MKRHAMRNRILFAAVVVAILSVTGIATNSIKAKAVTDIPVYIYAEYEDTIGLVGDKIDTSRLHVYAVYEDGSTNEVSDYSLSTEFIRKDGINEVSVLYLGERTSFYVTGRRVASLNAFYFGDTVGVGNAVDKRNVYVYVTYDDGTTEEVKDFTLYSSTITRVGENRIYIYYGGKSATITVTGRATGYVTSLQVVYAGDDVMIGSKINRDDIYVTAVYSDGMIETILNYGLSMESPTMIGANTVVVSYQYRTATFIVNGYEREVLKLSARYTGDGVEVGKEVRRSEIKVTATYTDGTVEEVEDFDLPTPVIYFIGAHVKTVHYMGMSADIYVIGVAEKETSYDNAALFSVTNGIRSALCQIALPADIDRSLIQGTSLAKVSVSRVVPRVIRKSDFIAFEITAEPDGDDELPLEMMITIPKGYNPQDCVLYYTPNRKTVVGRMNTEVTADGKLKVTLYKVGTFLLAYEPEPEEDDAVEE